LRCEYILLGRAVYCGAGAWLIFAQSFDDERRANIEG